MMVLDSNNPRGKNKHYSYNGTKEYTENQTLSYEELVKKYKNLLISYINQFTKRSEISDEIIQDVWLKLFLNLDKVRNRVAPWLYLVAKRQCIKYFRKESVVYTRSPEDITETIDSSQEYYSSPDSETLLSENIEILKSRIKKLKPIERQVLELRFFKDKSYNEISKVTGLKSGNVGFMLNKIKKDLYETFNNLKKLDNRKIHAMIGTEQRISLK